MNGTICPTCGAKMPMMTDGNHWVCTLCGDGWIFESLSGSQLCPHEDCAWYIVPAFDREDEANWYQCGHCERVIWAKPVDSDYEDWHMETARDHLLKKLAGGGAGKVWSPENMPIAFALQSSKHSPESARWDNEQQN